VLGAQPTEYVEPRRLGELHVEQHHVVGAGGALVEGRGAVDGGVHLVALVLEGEAHAAEHVGFVIYDQDCRAGHGARA
jgi:hypothetical protein